MSLALDVQVIKAGRSVYFMPPVISSARSPRPSARTLRDKIRFFCRFSLLIVDEIGYLRVVAGGGNLFFQLVNARYEKGAMILTSNRGFAEWGEGLRRFRRRYRTPPEVVHLHAPRIAFRAIVGATVLVVADQLFLLGID